jgi:hypothetical protein
VIGAKDRQPERRHVFECLAIKAVELLVAATNFEHRPQPLRQGFTVRFVMLIGALMRRSIDPLAILQSVEQAAVPGFARIQDDFEVESIIGISRFGSTVRRSHHHRANEIAIAIASPQPLPCLRPRRGDVPAAHDVVRLYFENVCEIATQRDLKLKINLSYAVVGDVEILVHPLADQPAQNETKCAGRNHAIRRRNGSIRKINSRSVGRYRPAIEKLTGFAIRVDSPTANDSRVKEIEALLAGPMNLSIRFTNQDCLAVMD